MLTELRLRGCEAYVLQSVLLWPREGKELPKGHTVIPVGFTYVHPPGSCEPEATACGLALLYRDR